MGLSPAQSILALRRVALRSVFARRSMRHEETLSGSVQTLDKPGAPGLRMAGFRLRLIERDS